MPRSSSSAARVWERPSPPNLLTGSAPPPAAPRGAPRVGADAAVLELGCQDLGEALHPELADGVRAPLGPSLDADAAHDVDHRGPLAQGGDGRLRGGVRTREVRVDHAPPLLLGVLLYGDPWSEKARVVYEDV